MAPLNRSSHEARPLRPLAASALGLYLLVNAFLILCLFHHPHNTHLQNQPDAHLDSVCEWVHNTVSSHMPSSRLILPFAAAILLVFLPSPQHCPQISLIRLTGRSPPLLAFA